MVATLKVRQPVVIRWKLREVMARNKVTNRHLAKALDMHEGSISRMKSADEMPRIDGKTLSKLCEELGCELLDLVEYVPDEEDSDA